ncbi:hypothetical protein OIU79_010847 [Salix purpurea]|uniref:Uncharacterized protein n=1 Tax=Salix purpurea TaxID=77065 RepID=A0A9Q0QH85_SALPP|nr:hypothetical protein OIU79_010847 [Salix purpurea]
MEEIEIDDDVEEQLNEDGEDDVIDAHIEENVENDIEAQCGANSKDEHFEPSSVCLAKMVQSYMEESNDKPFRGRHRCNCFNGNGNDNSDDEFDVFGCGFGESMGIAPSGDACDFLKSLIP